MNAEKNPRSLTVQKRDDGVAIATLDVPGKPVNTLSFALFDELRDAVAPLLTAPSVRAIVITSGKAKNFIAGADLNMIGDADTVDAASKISRDGNAMLSRIAASDKPVVAAIHGAALGGGLEVALACQYIVASDDPATQLGLPEVMLGLLPGGGGTQRLVQRVGLTAALPMLLTGKKVRAKKALKLGLVDAVTTPGGIAESAARAALALADGTLERREPSRRRKMEDVLAGLGPARSIVLKKAREQVQRKTRGLYPAPRAILDCVETGLAEGEAAGLAREAELFGELVVSPESRSLVWLFEAMTARKKAPKAVDGEKPREVSRLGVLGAGFMGAGIAAASINHCPVTLRDLSGAALASGAKVIRDGLKAQVRSGALRRGEMDRRWSRVQLTTDTAELEGSDLVIEAVFEDLDIKRKVLAEVETVLADDAVFASNTSALPISDIAAEAEHPERVLGMHYFSPVHRMPLLELVVTDETAPWAVATAQAFAAKQGKSTIVVKDGPGFYTTRILAPYLNEAMVVLEEGAAIEAVDRALKDFGYPVGPVALIDEVGVDVGAHVAKDLGAAFADRGGEPSDLLPKLVEAGMTGRKGGEGFYVYPPKGKKKPRKHPNERVYDFIGGGEREDIDLREVQDRLALIMVNEAVHCLAEGVIASPEDGDVGAILGLGFPPFRGGPFHHVDAIGVGAVVRRLDGLADAKGGHFRPAPLLVDMAKEGKKFYP